MVRVQRHLRKSKKYLYHGTQEECLIGIASKGIIPPSKSKKAITYSELWYRPTKNVVFLVDKEEMANTWACGTRCNEDENPDCHPVILRVRLDKLPERCKIERDIIPDKWGDFVIAGSWMARCSIPPEAVEIKDVKGWTPIREIVNG